MPVEAPDGTAALEKSILENKYLVGEFVKNILPKNIPATVSYT